MRPTAVHFGAGSIGRGFLGQLLTEAGFEVVFIDVQPELISWLNERRSYPLRLVSAEEQRQYEIGPVRAVDGRDSDAVAKEISQAGIISTAVGESVLPHIAGPLAQGLARRNDPVNVLICENLPNPAGTVRDLLLRHEPGLENAIGTRIGLAPCVVSRMVPVPDPSLLKDPLEVIAEPYKRLPVDARGLVGEVPALPGLERVENFPAYVKLKLYVHNAGHAAAAYHAFPKGYTTIHEAMQDPDITEQVEGVMREGCDALHRSEGLYETYLEDYREDLLERFRNPYLGDTVARVGRDPWRKLGREDRLIGAAKCALSQGIVPEHLMNTILAALKFNPPGDPSATRLQEWINRYGIPDTLQFVSGVSMDSSLGKLLIGYDEDAVLTDYVWNYCGRYMTEVEQLAKRAFAVEKKSRLGNYNADKAKKFQKEFGHRGNPEVIAALREGEAYRRKVKDRLTKEYGDLLNINRCPECQRIAKTPKAKLCLWCGHSWRQKEIANES